MHVHGAPAQAGCIFGGLVGRKGSRVRCVVLCCQGTSLCWGSFGGNGRSTVRYAKGIKFWCHDLQLRYWGVRRAVQQSAPAGSGLFFEMEPWIGDGCRMAPPLDLVCVADLIFS